MEPKYYYVKRYRRKVYRKTCQYPHALVVAPVPGKIIPKGELLYRIDQRDYLAAQAQGRAQIGSRKAAVPAQAAEKPKATSAPPP